MVAPIEGIEDSPFEMVMRGGESNGKKIRKTIFGQDVAAVNTHAVTEMVMGACLEDIDLPDFGVTTQFRAHNCVYAICAGRVRAMDRAILKYGMTENIEERMRAHRKTYPKMKCLFVISLGEYAAKPAEDSLKHSIGVRARAVEVNIGGTNQRECLACDMADVPSVTEGMMDEVKRHHGAKIVGVQYKGNVEMHEGVVSKCSGSGSTLEIEKEKTKQSMSLVHVEQEKTKQAKANTKASVELAKVELEKMRIQLQIAQLNTGRLDKYACTFDVALSDFLRKRFNGCKGNIIRPWVPDELQVWCLWYRPSQPCPLWPYTLSGAVPASEITIMGHGQDAIPTTDVVAPIEGIEDSPFEMVMRGGKSNGKKMGVGWDQL